MRGSAFVRALTIFGAIAVALGNVNSEARAETRKEIIVYAAAASGAALVEKICRTYRSDISAVLRLKAAADIKPDEQTAVSSEMDAMTRGSEKAIEQYGERAWCERAWQAMGPLGALIPGILRKR